MKDEHAKYERSPKFKRLKCPFYVETRITYCWNRAWGKYDACHKCNALRDKSCLKEM